jgi:glutathione S-transferase
LHGTRDAVTMSARMPPITLYQFPISHYCEKIRWVLEHKGIAYAVKNQFPGPHAFTNRRRVGRSTVPLLIDGHHAIGNSSDIALYLDDQFPERRLIPHEPEQRARVLALEAYFDEQAGPAVRRYVYSFVTRRADLFRQVFFRGYDSARRTAGALTSRVLVKAIGGMYRVNDVSAAESLAILEAVFARVESLTDGDPERYLCGPDLTLADITAASLLAPLVAPENSPWAVEISIPEVLALRERLRARDGGRWVLARYAQNRAASPSA